MVIAVFGTPSPISLWGIHAIRTMASVVIGEFDFIEAGVIEDLRAAWDKRVTKTLILFADAPDTAIAKIFASLDIPIILFVDEPSDAVGFSMTARHMDLISAVRHVTMSISALGDLFRLRRAQIIRRDPSNKSVRGLLKAIAGYHDIRLTREQMNETLRRLDPDQTTTADCSLEDQIRYHVAGVKPVGFWAAELQNAEQNLVRTVLAGYEDVTHQLKLNTVTWPREVFYNCNPRGEFLKTPLPLTGPGRFLIYGPYLHLTPGQWIAKVHFEVGENFSGNSILVDVVCRNVITAGRFKLPESGSFEFDLEFETDAPKLPIEVRFVLENGAIEGWFDLIKVVMVRRNAA
jgi:hypothetical protein